jgi:hypothetical protein
LPHVLASQWSSRLVMTTFARVGDYGDVSLGNRLVGWVRWLVSRHSITRAERNCEKKIEYCKMNGQRTGTASKRIAARNRRIEGVAEYRG